MPGSAKVLAGTDVRRLLRHVGRSRYPPRNRVIVLLSFKAGLRAAEIAGLSWPMVLKPGGGVGSQLNVASSIAKGGRRRTVPLHPDLKSQLISLHRLQDYPASGPIVPSEWGAHFTPRGIVNWFAAIYAETGLEGCSSHSGRRTFITQTARLLAKAGGSLRDVQELAGHRALSTTERYIEGDRDAQRKLVRLL